MYTTAFENAKGDFLSESALRLASAMAVEHNPSFVGYSRAA